jgi:hypothetical protein
MIIYTLRSIVSKLLFAAANLIFQLQHALRALGNFSAKAGKTLIRLAARIRRASDAIYDFLLIPFILLILFAVDKASQEYSAHGGPRHFTPKTDTEMLCDVGICIIAVVAFSTIAITASLKKTTRRGPMVLRVRPAAIEFGNN